MMQIEKIESYHDLLCLLKSCLWDTEYKSSGIIDYKKLYSQFIMHAIVALPIKQLKSFVGIDEELRNQWKNEAYRVIYNHIRISQIQKELIQKLKEQNIKFVILKGSSATCYYPDPSLRLMGDVDIMTCREDFDKAESLLQSFCAIIPEDKIESERHTDYIYKGVVIELHKRFASFNDPEKTQYLDNLILMNISDNTKLNDEINGLVLLQHINQHLETGIGLRQIIDWIYYVNSYLDDENWKTHFAVRTKRVGLDKLAITVTKLCKDYLGLNSSITWCDTADNSLCKELLLYILESGNFGINKKNNDDAVSNVIIKYKNPFDMLKGFQKNGRKNWKAAQKNKILVPFAWMYESVKLIKTAWGRKIHGHSFLKGYIDSRSRRKLMRKLGARDISLGTAKHIDGKLINEKQHR